MKEVQSSRYQQRMPNWNLISRIIGTMRSTYLWIGVASFILMALPGSLAVKRMIELAPDNSQAWIAWLIIAIVSAFSLYGNFYSSYLQGTNHVALFRRWEAVFSLCSIITSFLVLLFRGNLLALVIANQSWAVINILRNRFFCGRIKDGVFRKHNKFVFCKDVFHSIWPPAWRSGIGILMGYGIFNSTGIVFAQFGTVENVAIYLFALRLIQTINLFSQAPFYSKLPLLSKLYAEGNAINLIKNVKRGMLLSYLAYALLFGFSCILGNQLFTLIGSNIVFPDRYLWSLLGIGFFIERYGAMHIQIYSLTNKIIWHIANGITGLIFIIIAASILSVYNNMLAFPIALIASYLGFFTWYGAKHSYKLIDDTFILFEIKTSGLPLIIIVVSILMMIII